MSEAKNIPPIARGNVWTGMPTLQWPVNKPDRGCVRSASRSRPEFSTLRLCLGGVLPHARSADRRVRVFPVRHQFKTFPVAGSKSGTRLTRPSDHKALRQNLAVRAPFSVHRNALAQMNPSEWHSKNHCSSRRSRAWFATLVLRHASVRVLLNLAAMARKPRHFHWHLRCIGREFYGRTRKK